VGESGMIRTQMGSTIVQQWSQCMGRHVRYHRVNNNSNGFICVFLSLLVYLHAMLSLFVILPISSLFSLSFFHFYGTVTTIASKSRGLRFKYRSRARCFDLRFVVFLNNYNKIVGWYLKLCHSRFLPLSPPVHPKIVLSFDAR
jgi:hypothetical protein